MEFTAVDHHTAFKLVINVDFPKEKSQAMELCEIISETTAS